MNISYNQHYQLLRFAGSEHLYTDIPIVFLHNNYFKYVPYLIHANNDFRINKKDVLWNNLLSSDKPKILLNSENNFTKISNLINNIVIGDETTETSYNLDIGAIIFENADRFISSNFMIKSFIEWLNNVIDDSFTLLFHFSKPQSDFLNEFKHLTNSLVLDFSNPILMNNNVLKEHSLDYHNKLNLTQNNVLKNYNIDSKSFFIEKNVKIINPTLENGNVDLYLFYAQQSLNSVKKDILKNRIFFNYAVNLLYSLPNLAIDPLRLKINFNVNGAWRYISIPYFLGLFKNKLNKEKDINKLPLNNLIANLSNIFHELSRCKHYFEDNGYDRVSKSYKILDIAVNKADYFDDDKKLLIGTFQKNEDSHLNKILSDVDDVESYHLTKLFLNFNDFSEYNLLLPGIIYNTKNVSILESNFNQILILAYGGYNYNLIQKQIEMVLNPPLNIEKVSMDYHEELYKFMNLSIKNGFFNDYDQRRGLFDVQELNEDKYEDLFDLHDSYDEYMKGNEKSNAEIENFLVNSSISSKNYPVETVEVILSSLSDGKIYTKELVRNRKYLRFKSYDDLENSLEVRPDLFKKK